MDISSGAGAMAAQLAPFLQRVMLGLAPILDQPVVRKPYAMSLSESQVIPPGATVILTPTDFSYSFEWPFEIHRVGFDQDPAHTFRDWRVSILDQIFNQPLEKSNNGSLVSTLIDTNTGKWEWDMPWVMRPKGGAFSIQVTNLDDVNPITVDIAFLGYQMIPR